MYTGTLIEDLIGMVERAEEHAQEDLQDEELEHWYAVAQHERPQLESNLAGVV